MKTMINTDDMNDRVLKGIADDEALAAQRERDREWAQTEIGRLFYAYERTYSHAWVIDTEAGFRENVSDKRLKAEWDKASEARAAFLTALRGFG